MPVHRFDDVTLLITHYNRSRSLGRLLAAFRRLDCRFGDIVVSDDGSRPEHLAQVQALQEEYGFRLVTTQVNKGLGNNINKGQDAVTTPYTLYVQEDFEPSGIFPGHFADALQFMEESRDLDIVRLYAYFPYPAMKPRGKGFSGMIYRWWNMNHIKVYMYSDHPHLRRSSFFEKFGRYREGIPPDATEYSMAVAFLQHKGKGLFYNDFTTLFYQKNEADEPSTIGRADWRQSRNPLVLLLREVYLKYRLLKVSWDIKFKR